MEEVFTYLNRLHSVPGSMESELESMLQVTGRKKNEYLLNENEVCRHAWYLQKGLVRCYYDRDDRQVTMWFAKENDVVVICKSLSRQKKSLFYLQALEDCELYTIHYLDLQALFGKYPEAVKFKHAIAEHYSNLKDKKIRATSMLTPKERYRYFEKHFPHLPGRLKLEYIASYLDLSLRSLARARGY